LFNEEAHLLVGSDITSLEQLRGRKVNLDEVGSGTSYSVRTSLHHRPGTRSVGFRRLRIGGLAAVIARVKILPPWVV
jgi:hypothetical protein